MLGVAVPIYHTPHICLNSLLETWEQPPLQNSCETAALPVTFPPASTSCSRFEVRAQEDSGNSNMTNAGKRIKITRSRGNIPSP